MNWSEITSGQKFVTDLGASPSIVDPNTKKQQKIPRYAVWIPSDDNTQHVLCEVGDDLKYLKSKHKIVSTATFEVA